MDEAHVSWFEKKNVDLCKLDRQKLYDCLGLLESGMLDLPELEDGFASNDGWSWECLNPKQPTVEPEPEIKIEFTYFCKVKDCGAGCTISSEQTRSGDEGMTNYATCTNSKCKRRYVIH